MTRSTEKPLLGCIADDYTGATDLASVLRRSGYSTRLYFDGPDAEAPTDVDAVVIALKTRTAPLDQALQETRGTHNWMREQGVSKYFIKYCSTMDSTDSGNIGPVIDFIMQQEGQTISIVVPSYPDNGRTVSGGILYVHGTPLAQSPMRDHPLTPMKTSAIAEILKPQTIAQIAHIRIEEVRSGRAASVIQSLRATENSYLVLIDALTNDDIRLLHDVAAGLRVITGGAALAQALPSPARSSADGELFRATPGHRLILSGSASATTQEQVQHAMDHMTTLRLDPDALGEDQMTKLAEAAVQAWSTHPAEWPVLIYSTSAPTDVSQKRASAVEDAFAALATRLIFEGARQLVVAGGETSGAVVQRLGISHLDLGPEVAPGVIWGAGITRDEIALNLALKSGNFGPPELFTSAWEMLSCQTHSIN